MAACGRLEPQRLRRRPTGQPVCDRGRRFRYSIDTPGNDFDHRYGIAVAIDGVWKITRNTICQDLSLAGGDCGGGWEPISPLGS